MEKVLYRKENDTAWIILNRPEKRNAIDGDVMDELKIIFNEAKSDPKVKCLVITGTGDVFCSGGDLTVFHHLETAEDAEVMLSKMGNILYDLFTFPKPTIAMLNGTAVGGGLEIATACDFRIAKRHANIGFIQGTLGITTGWGGATFLFERLPQQIAMALLTTAQRITAERAFKLGFLHKVVSDDLTLDGVATVILESVPMSINVLSAYKRRYLDSVNLTELHARLKKEIHECSLLWEMEEHKKAVQRFLKSKMA